MPEKSERLAGIIVFSALTIFIFWYVDFEQLEVVGFGTRPKGYGSIAYQILSTLYSKELYQNEDSYQHDWSNFLWVITQSIPLLISWPIRKNLGIITSHALQLVHKLYCAL